MQDPQLWNMISLKLSGNGTAEENEEFIKWHNSNAQNAAYFLQVKSVWENTVDQSISFKERFSLPKVKLFIRDQALGNLVGFVVGMWVVATFSHEVLERKSIHNLFGLVKRKKVVVNEIPEWLQSTISVLIGYIVLEMINYFFRSKKHILIWNYLRKTGPQSVKDHIK